MQSTNNSMIFQSSSQISHHLWKFYGLQVIDKKSKNGFRILMSFWLSLRRQNTNGFRVGTPNIWLNCKEELGSCFMRLPSWCMMMRGYSHNLLAPERSSHHPHPTLLKAQLVGQWYLEVVPIHRTLFLCSFVRFARIFLINLEDLIPFIHSTNMWEQLKAIDHSRRWGYSG